MSLRGILIETAKLPPLRWAARRVYDRFFERQRRGNHYRGVYSSYAQAMQHTPTTFAIGFDNETAASKYRHRINELTVSEYPVLLWMSRLMDQHQRKFFDLGGHFGLFYYAMQRYRRLPHDLHWTVCDLPAVIKSGQEWARDHDPSRRLSFTTTPADTSGQDVLLILGTLQYLDYSLDDLLGKLEKRPAYVIVNLTPMHPTLDFFTIQNMGFSFAPYHVMSVPNFVSAMQALGYSVIDQWQSFERDCHIPFAPKHDVKHYSGFVLQHADAEPLTDLSDSPTPVSTTLVNRAALS
jgi:putative methyltransferase (TIGR04325 family)